MSAGVGVALLHSGRDPGNAAAVEALAAALAGLGDRPRVVTSHAGAPGRAQRDGVTVVRNWRPPDLPLRLRNIEPGITHLPFTYASLTRGDDQVAHAFDAAEAATAVRWARRSRRPVVFTCAEAPARETVASNRLRRRIMEQAMLEADVVTTADQRARDAVWRWFGVEARLIDPRAPDGPRACHDLYRELLSRPG